MNGARLTECRIPAASAGIHSDHCRVRRRSLHGNGRRSQQQPLNYHAPNPLPS